MQKEGIDLKNCLYVHGGHEEKASWQECGHFFIIIAACINPVTHYSSAGIIDVRSAAHHRSIKVCR